MYSKSWGLRENGGKLGKTKLYGQLVQKHPVTTSTFEGYLETLNALGKIKVPLLTYVLIDPIIELVGKG